MKKLVSIVIVNWNSGDYLNQCIASINQEKIMDSSEIIIVDNNSDDHSLEKINYIKDIIIIKSEVNLGFAKACNLGAKQASSEFILFLNPDTVFLSNPINPILRFMSSPENASVGICGIKLLDQNRNVAKSCSRFPSLKSLFVHCLGLNKIFKSFASPMLNFDHMQNTEVDQVIGAFFFIRSELFQMLDGFDERFFVYYEEVDFSLRAREIGYRSFFLADEEAMHIGGGSSDNVKSTRLFYNLRSRLIFFKKNHSYFVYFISILATFIFEFISRLIYAVILVKKENLLELLKGYFLLYKWFFFSRKEY